MKKRTTFSELVKTRSGMSTDGDSVFVTKKDSSGKLNSTYILRKPRVYKQTEGKDMFRQKHTEATRLWKILPEPFKEQLKVYTVAYNKQYRKNALSIHAYNLYTGVLLSQNQAFISIKSIADTLGNSVDEWIKRGFLKPLRRKEPLNKPLT